MPGHGLQRICRVEGYRYPLHLTIDRLRCPPPVRHSLHRLEAYHFRSPYRAYRAPAPHRAHLGHCPIQEVIFLAAIQKEAHSIFVISASSTSTVTSNFFSDS
jgi:hypothetical protein